MKVKLLKRFRKEYKYTFTEYGIDIERDNMIIVCSNIKRYLLFRGLVSDKYYQANKFKNSRKLKTVSVW